MEASWDAVDSFCLLLGCAHLFISYPSLDTVSILDKYEVVDMECRLQTSGAKRNPREIFWMYILYNNKFNIVRYNAK